MDSLKYKIIKTSNQYDQYCLILEGLTANNDATVIDDIELLTWLVEKWDLEHYTFEDLDPIEFILALMEQNGLRQKDLVDLLNLSKGTISKILNYRKGLSKASIRKLASHFKVTQEAFNRPYKLKEVGISETASTGGI